MNAYRNGAHNPRNIYRAGSSRDTDEHVAVAFTPEFGRAIVHALNQHPPRSYVYEVLQRIAGAHQQNVDAAGGVSGFCGECDQVYPCPTRRWATLSVTDPDSPWETDTP